MKILVTGGAGFIGSHIADALIEQGHTVVILDDLSSGRVENINPKALFIKGSIGDDQLLYALFDEHRFDVVNHHAAQIDVRKSVADPVSDASINIVGTIRLLQASVRYKIKRFFFASTGGAIYGKQEHFPAVETDIPHPDSPYGVAKLSVEHYLHYYKSVHGLDHTIFRYANVYGPRQDPKGEAGVVAIFCNAMLNAKQCMIFGDGKQTRDYIFVTDIVRAHLLALKNDHDSTIYNLGTGIETDVNTLHTAISQISHNTIPPLYQPARLGELDRSVCSYQKIEKALGWKPSVLLNQGLKETYGYFQHILTNA